MENKYLVKIAEDYKKKKVGLGKSLGIAALTGTVAGSVAQVAGSAGLMNSGLYTGEGYNHEADGHTIRRFIKDNKLKVSFNDKNPDIHKVKSTRFGARIRDMIKNHGAPAYIHAQHHGYSKNFITKNKGRFPNKKVNDAIMHELGHAKNWKHMPASVGLAYSINRGALGTAGSFGTSAALLSNEKTEKYAPLAAVAHQSPILLDETMAHVHAFGAIKKAKGLKAALRFAKNTVAPALGTYGAAAAGEIGGAMWAKHIVHNIRNKGNK